jgi:hypothetical protein
MKPRKSSRKFPKGWSAARVERLVKHYESQTAAEAVAEDEAAFDRRGQTMIMVPTELVPEIRKLLAKRRH